MPQDGRFRIIGFYNPRTNPITWRLRKRKSYEWKSKGAHPTESVLNAFQQCWSDGSVQSILKLASCRKTACRGKSNSAQSDREESQTCEGNHALKEATPAKEAAPARKARSQQKTKEPEKKEEKQLYLEFSLPNRF